MVQQMNRSASEQANEPDTLAWSPRVVYIKATIKGLPSPLIPFAVLKEDPLPAFRQFIDTSLYRLNEPDEAHLAMQEAWNKPFAVLCKEQIFFLYAWSSVPEVSPKVVEIAQLTFGIATPGQLYKRWVTTFAVERQSELVAWCEEVDMLDRGKNEVREIVFCEERMIRLNEVGEFDFKVA